MPRKSPPELHTAPMPLAPHVSACLCVDYGCTGTRAFPPDDSVGFCAACWDSLPEAGRALILDLSHAADLAEKSAEFARAVSDGALDATLTGLRAERFPEKPQAQPVPGRGAALERIADNLYAMGGSRENVMVTLKEANRALCDSPIDDSEVERIAIAQDPITRLKAPRLPVRHFHGETHDVATCPCAYCHAERIQTAEKAPPQPVPPKAKRRPRNERTRVHPCEICGDYYCLKHD